MARIDYRVLSERRAMLERRKTVWDFALRFIPASGGGDMAVEMWKAADGGG